MRIVRSPDPGPLNHYRAYKPHLQTLFRCRCAYCLSHEQKMGQFAAMEVDHFKPKGRPEFAHLEHEWTNLYYCCRICNQHKSNRWPTDQQMREGLRFVDPCEEDPDEHFRLCLHPRHDELCWLTPLTPAARYTIEKIRLNRDQLIQIRRSLAAEEREEQDRLLEITRLIECLDADVRDRDSSSQTDEMMCVLDALRQQSASCLDEIRSLRPFPVSVGA